MRRSITSDGPHVAPRAGVTGVVNEPIVATQSFEAPSRGHRRKLGVPREYSFEEQVKDAPTRRGGPRPITQTSIKAVTGDYAKADDNESGHRPPVRRITEQLPSFEVPPEPSHRDRELNKRIQVVAAAPQATEAVPKGTVRQAWMQGALTGALILTLAWLASLIART